MAPQKIFCAQCAADKPFELSVDGNHEILAVDDQGHHLKFPAPKDAAELKAMIAQHKAENEPRAKQAAADNTKRKAVESILADLK